MTEAKNLVERLAFMAEFPNPTEHKSSLEYAKTSSEAADFIERLSAPVPVTEAIEMLLLAAERVDRKYGHRENDEPIDWTEWQDLRDGIVAVHSTLAPSVASEPSDEFWEPNTVFEFDRYINGTLMAEGVIIEKQNTLEGAVKAAARMAARGPNGETPVLVYRPALSPGSEQLIRERDEAREERDTQRAGWEGSHALAMKLDYERHEAEDRAEAAERERDEARAWQDIIAERKRQMEAEGWTPEHDDKHDLGELAKAAASYAAGSPDWYWPWEKKWWKPTNRRRDLVKAGALILAEIERLDRKEASNG